MALTQPKRPVGGAYGIFLAEKRPEFLKACEGQKASAISVMAGEQWKKLSASQQAPYQKKYEVAKATFDKDMAAFLAAGGEISKGQMALRSEKRNNKLKKGKAKDPNAPKKPTGGGYGVFLSEHRPRIVKSLPEGHQITDVTKAASVEWNALSDSGKKPYITKYNKKMESYKLAAEEYKAICPGSVENENVGAEGEPEEEDENDEIESEPRKRPAAPELNVRPAAQAVDKRPAGSSSAGPAAKRGRGTQ